MAAFSLTIRDSVASDVYLLPPTSQTSFSTDGLFRIVVQRETPSDPNAIACLSKKNVEGQFTKVWQKTVDVEFGPRFLFVTDKGFVIFFDHQINVLPDTAITVYEPNGQTLRRVSSQQLEEMSQVSLAQIGRVAKFGLFSSRPVYSTKTINFGVGDQNLQISLDDFSVSTVH